MSKPRDVNGDPANQTFESLTAEVNQLRQEVERLRAEAAELRRALEAARVELKDKAAIAAERDEYRKSLHAVLHEDWTFTEEEIADLEKNGVEFTKEFIDELERDLRSMERRDG